jgi:hypothetical protein
LDKTRVWPIRKMRSLEIVALAIAVSASAIQRAHSAGHELKWSACLRTAVGLHGPASQPAKQLKHKLAFRPLGSVNQCRHVGRSRLSGQLSGPNRGLIAAGEHMPTLSMRASNHANRSRFGLKTKHQKKQPSVSEFFKKDGYAAIDRYDFWHVVPLMFDRDVGGALTSALLRIGGLIIGGPRRRHYRQARLRLACPPSSLGVAVRGTWVRNRLTICVVLPFGEQSNSLLLAFSQTNAGPIAIAMMTLNSRKLSAWSVRATASAKVTFGCREGATGDHVAARNFILRCWLSSVRFFWSQWVRSYTLSATPSELSSAFFPKQINDVAISDGSNDYSIAEFSARMAVSEIAATERNPWSRAVGRQRLIHMPIAMTIADKAMIVRSIVSHDGVEGCLSIALRLYPSTSSPWVAQANAR